MVGFLKRRIKGYLFQDLTTIWSKKLNKAELYQLKKDHGKLEIIIRNVNREKEKQKHEAIINCNHTRL